MEYLVVDGYNVINAWGDIFDLSRFSLEDCRDRLIQMLLDYQGFWGRSVMVVFDAHLTKGSVEHEEMINGLKIVFTKENETADNYIEKFVYQLGRIHTIRVVTSDYLEQTIILRSGGIRITPKELKAEINKARNHYVKHTKEEMIKTNTVLSNLNPELVEKLEILRRGK